MMLVRRPWQAARVRLVAADVARPKSPTRRISSRARSSSSARTDGGGRRTTRAGRFASTRASPPPPSRTRPAAPTRVRVADADQRGADTNRLWTTDDASPRERLQKTTSRRCRRGYPLVAAAAALTEVRLQRAHFCGPRSGGRVKRRHTHRRRSQSARRHRHLETPTAKSVLEVRS